MEIEVLKIADLAPYAKNSRTHSEAQQKKIERSIKEFGFTNPILIDANGVIIAGHARIQAAKHLGLKEVPCLRLSHMTESQKRAYIIADNRLAEDGGWDKDVLEFEVEELKALGFDITLTGFEVDDFFQHEEIKLTTVDTRPPPKLSWVLIGIPIVRFGEIQAQIEAISSIEDVVVKTTVSD